MRKLLVIAALLALAGCYSAPRDPGTVVFLIESSPANLDPRIGTDGQSEHIDELLFDGLVARDASFHFTPALAESWEQPDSLTLIFHLRSGVRFHDGRPLTARDVLWTINSMRSGAVISPKTAAYAAVDAIEAPDDRTVIFHLKHPDGGSKRSWLGRSGGGSISAPCWPALRRHLARLRAIAFTHTRKVPFSIEYSPIFRSTSMAVCCSTSSACSSSFR